jgi:hypothetical protein
MTEPVRNIEIAIARAYYESEVESSNFPDAALSWSNLPIVIRTKRANIVNSLIIQGIITPGEKFSS